MVRATPVWLAAQYVFYVIIAPNGRVMPCAASLRQLRHSVRGIFQHRCNLMWLFIAFREFVSIFVFPRQCTDPMQSPTLIAVEAQSGWPAAACALERLDAVRPAGPASQVLHDKPTCRKRPLSGGSGQQNVSSGEGFWRACYFLGGKN